MEVDEENGENMKQDKKEEEEFVDLMGSGPIKGRGRGMAGTLALLKGTKDLERKEEVNTSNIVYLFFNACPCNHLCPLYILQLVGRTKDERAPVRGSGGVSSMETVETDGSTKVCTRSEILAGDLDSFCNFFYKRVFFMASYRAS